MVANKYERVMAENALTMFSTLEIFDEEFTPFVELHKIKREMALPGKDLSSRIQIMAYDTIIAGGTVITAEGRKQADVAFKGESIAAVGKGLAARNKNGAVIVDAKNKYVIPGGIDAHVHLELPFCGTISSDDWVTGTRAAARGGVTTVIDFAIPYGEDSLEDAFNKWSDKGILLHGPGDDGSWSVDLDLEPGKYQYMFVVDEAHWIADENADAWVDDGFGHVNSVMVVM